MAIVIIGIIGPFAYELEVQSRATTGTRSTWTATSAYPLEFDGTYGVAGQSCVADAGYAYCTGGQDYRENPYNNVYSSSLSTKGAGNWTAESSYPVDIVAESCVAYSGYLYCVGGTYSVNGNDVALSYYTTVSSGTLGTWNSTTKYPIPADSQSCAAASGYIYCVGGDNETNGTYDNQVLSNSVWYAPISSSGIGKWALSLVYPPNIYFPSCAATTSEIYCLGGVNSTDDAVNSAYAASLSSSGVGAWTKTTDYPVSLVGLACTISSAAIYCVGGKTQQDSYSSVVYHASLYSDGIGSWQKGVSYPISVESSCVASSTDLYCAGGFVGGITAVTNDVYYASLVSL